MEIPTNIPQGVLDQDGIALKDVFLLRRQVAKARRGCKRLNFENLNLRGRLEQANELSVRLMATAQRANHDGNEALLREQHYHLRLDELRRENAELVIRLDREERQRLVNKRVIANLQDRMAAADGRIEALEADTKQASYGMEWSNGASPQAAENLMDRIEITEV